MFIYIYIYITQIYMSGMCRSALHSIQHALILVYTSFPKQNKNNIYCMYIYIHINIYRIPSLFFGCVQGWLPSRT